MIRDAFLNFTRNDALGVVSADVAGAGNFASLGAVPFYYPLPRPAALTINTLDLQSVRDLGQGRPITARFIVETTFNSSDAGILVAPAIGVGATADGASQVAVAVGAPLVLGSWTAGSWQDVILPPTLTTGQFVTLGLFVVATTITFGNALWSAGVISAHLQSEAPPAALPRHNSGWLT